MKIAKTLQANVPVEAEREIYVQGMSRPGVELILGVRNEPGFGSFVVGASAAYLLNSLNRRASGWGP